MGKTEIFVGLGIALLAAALNFLFPKLPTLVVWLVLLVAIVFIVLGILASHKKNEQNLEIIRMRQDAQRLKELLLSYHGSFEDQKKEIGDLIEGFRNSKSLVWTDAKTDQLRRDFLQYCGIAFSREKYFYDSKEEEVTTRGKINEFWKKLDNRLSRNKIPLSNEQEKAGDPKGPVAIKISRGRNNKFIGNKYFGPGRFFDIEEGEGNEFLGNVHVDSGNVKTKSAQSSKTGRVPLVSLRDEIIKRGWKLGDSESLHVLDFIKAFRQAGHDGALTIWGQPDRNSFTSLTKDEVLTIIPKDHWVDYTINSEPLFSGGDNFYVKTHTGRHNDQKGFVNLHVDYNQFLDWLPSAEAFKGEREAREK